MDDIYNRSPLGVSSPTNFVHNVHVGFDAVSGAFTGLPDQWIRLLTNSALTKEDYAKNPQAVLDVLEFYTESQKRERDEFAGAAALPVASAFNSPQLGSSPQLSSSSTSRFAAGTGLAGQRNDGPSLQPSSVAPPLSRLPSDNSVNSNTPPTPRQQPSSRQPDDSSLASRLQSSTLNSQPPASYPRSPPAAETSSTSSSYDRPKNPPARSDSSSSQRPGLVPHRPAPAVPPTARPVDERALGSSSLAGPTQGLKPLKMQVNRPTVAKQPSTSSVQTSSKAIGAPPSAAFAQEPPRLSSQAEQKKPAPAKQGNAGSNRRISNMNDREVQEKLKSVTCADDPTRLYTKLKKVGQGASGSVYVARINETGEKVAIKQMDLAQQPRKELIVNEILVMKESQHRNIVNFRESFLIKTSELWVVMDYMEGGALTDIIDTHSLEEDQIAGICREVSGTLPVELPLLILRVDMSRPATSSLEEHHSQRHQKRQCPPRCAWTSQNQ